MKAFISSTMDLNDVTVNYPNVNVKETDGGIIFTPSDISYLNRVSIGEQNHFMVNGFANAWYINPQQINNGTGSFSVTIYYLPQSYYYVGLSITAIIVVACVGYLFYDSINGGFLSRIIQRSRRHSINSTSNFWEGG